MIYSVVIASIVPLVFLYVIHWLDLYKTDRPRIILLALAWGVAAAGLSYLVNHPMIGVLGRQFVSTRTAPFVEEFFKALILIYLVRRADFTYFVDGAIYGFAAGIGFAVAENMLYLSRVDVQTGLLVAIARSFSTSLMHGGATALVGIALGSFRLARGNGRVGALIMGWTAAIILHFAFNTVAYRDFGEISLFAIAGVGFSGLLLVAGFILWGLHQERGWLRESLGMRVGVSGEEASVVQHLDDLDRLLAPIQLRFGKAKRNQVADFLHLEAQMGLKEDLEEKTLDPHLRVALATQVAELEKQLDRQRRDVGVYVMLYVRSIFPQTAWSLWARLGQTLANNPPTSSKAWDALRGRLGAGSAPDEGIYARILAELDARAQATALTMRHVHELPEAMQKCMHWVMREVHVTVAHVASGLGHHEAHAHEMLVELVSRGFLHRSSKDGQVAFRARVLADEKSAARPHIWESLARRKTTRS